MISKAQLVSMVETEAVHDAQCIGMTGMPISEMFEDLIKFADEMNEDTFVSELFSCIKDSMDMLTEHVDFYHPFKRQEFQADSPEAREMIEYLYANPATWRFSNSTMRVKVREDDRHFYLIPSYKKHTLTKLRDSACFFDAAEVQTIRTALGRMLGPEEFTLKAGKSLGTLIHGYQGTEPVLIPFQDQNNEERLRDWTVLTKEMVKRWISQGPVVDIFSF